jgi:WD40 repeat protein/DNA-binding SARP family transcriptional activator
MAASRVEFRILGPLTVRVDGIAVPVGGPKQRGLLALLLLSANRVVSRDRLVAELFAERSLNSADHALRNHVSRLRKVLAPAVAGEPRLVARAPGYLLRVEHGELDLERFEQLVAAGRESLAAGDPAPAVEALRAAESLWDGNPLADLEFEPFGRVEVERLEELRLAAVEERIDVELGLGRRLGLVAELEALCVQHPFRERFRAQLMLALYRSGRQTEGLEVYRRTRDLLNVELGLEPGVELQQLERAILVQDPALTVVARPERGGPAPLRNVCPFKGLAPFEPGDADLFFGRERLVDELKARLGSEPLLAIVGASGSGKSSLLRAGLLPALGREWLLLRPGDRRVTELAVALERVPPGERFIVAVDQFEELFDPTVAEGDRVSFMQTLVDATWDPDRRFVILLALRADFFGHLARYTDVADLVGANHILLGPMRVAELRRAIEAPAERTGLTVEPALVDTLVDEVTGEAGALPLLSTALLGLWRERDGDTLTLASYVRSGGVRGAVARHVESAYRSLDDQEQRVARRILLRIVSRGDGGSATSRRVSREEFDAGDDERVAGVLAALIERRLLVADDGTIELVHEAVLEHWPRLIAWLEEDVQGGRLHRHLTHAAAGWAAAGREQGELYRGARLAAALEWTDAAGDEAGLNRVEREFLEESRRAFSRANRRLRALLAVAVLLLAAAVVAGGIALAARDSAEHAATAAIAERLGAQALVEPSLDRSLLLAREGMRLDDSVTTRSNLLAALLRAPAAVGVAHEGSDRLLDEAISPDGTTLVVRGDDGNVVFFDARTLRALPPRLAGDSQIGLIGAVRGPLRALAFNPRGRTLAVGGTDGLVATLDLVDTRTHRARVHVISARSLLAADVAFAPDGRTFATGESTTGTTTPPPAIVVVRDARTGAPRAQTDPIPGGRLVGYTHDGRFLLVVSGERKSLLLDARTLRLVRGFPLGGATAVSPASDDAAFGGRDGAVTIVDLRTNRSTVLAGRTGRTVEAIGFSSDGRLLATGGDDGTVVVWDVRAGSLREVFQGHSAAVRAATFSPDERTLYTAANDGSVIAWDLSGSRRLGRAFRYTSRSSGHSASAVSPDGVLFAVSAAPNHVTVWRSRPRVPLTPVLVGPVGDVKGLAFSPDGKLVVAAGSANTVLWSLETKRIARILPAGSHGAIAVAFTSDGRTLAIGRSDGVDALYDVRTGKERAELVGTGSTVSVDFSPDGKLLASASLTGTVTLWNVAAQLRTAELPGAIAAFAVAFSPDGKLLAAGDSSGHTIFWDVSTGRRVGRPLVGHGSHIESIAFNPAGGTLATASGDGKLRLWDVASRKLVGGALAGSDTGGSVDFFPDGKQILGVFGSGDAVVWKVDSAAWATKACNVARRNLTPSELQDFLGRGSDREVCG